MIHLKTVGGPLPCLFLATGGMPAILGFPWFSGTQSTLCLHILMAFSLCVSLFTWPSNKDTSHIVLEAHLTPIYPHLKKLYLQWPSFQISSHSEVPGVRTFWGETYFGGIYSSTHNKSHDKDTCTKPGMEEAATSLWIGQASLNNDYSQHRPAKDQKLSSSFWDCVNIERLLHNSRR